MYTCKLSKNPKSNNMNTSRVFVCFRRKMTYRQPAPNGVLTDQLCRSIFYIHLSFMPMQIAITVTLSDNWLAIL